MAFIALAVLLVGIWQNRTLVDGDAPAFDGELADGTGALNLADTLQAADTPLLLHFWATWCGVCAMMDDQIEAIARNGRTVTVAYQSGDARAVAQHLSRQQREFPAVVDPQGVIASQYGITAVPTSFILRPDGSIAFRSVGYSTGWGLRARLWLARYF